jgi:acyl-CoA hydrolase
VACPYFVPTEKWDGGGWLHPSRLPLGGGWQGHCSAPGHEQTQPEESEVREFCNLGYAKNCGRLPHDRQFDAVRFCVTSDHDQHLLIAFTGRICSSSSRIQAAGIRRVKNAMADFTSRSANPKTSRLLYPVLSATPNKNLMTQTLAPRPVCDSYSEMNEIVLPNDTNPLGALLGGRLMHWIDMAGALAAHRHSHSYVVTASIDHMDFWVPVHVGDLVILRSAVNRVFHTSMEVGVKAWMENYLHGTRKHISSAYLTFVAVDGAGGRLQAPPVIPETADEKRRFEDAGRRREIRNAERDRRLKNSGK